MAKRKPRPNAATGKPANDKAADQPKDANAQTASADGAANPPAAGGGGGGDGAAGAASQAVNLDQDATRYFGGAAGEVMDPDGNPASDKVPFADTLFAAMYAAEQMRNPVPVNPEYWDNEVLAFTALAEFFRTFPDSPDDSGLVQLQRLKIELPEEHRPGLLLAMIRVFRVALDQLDQLDREDAARAEAEKPKPEPEKWREAKGFKQTKKALQPGSGLKPRR